MKIPGGKLGGLPVVEDRWGTGGDLWLCHPFITLKVLKYHDMDSIFIITSITYIKIAKWVTIDMFSGELLSGGSVHYAYLLRKAMMLRFCCKTFS